MILEAAIVLIAVGYAVYKHVGATKIAADVKTAVTKAEAAVSSAASTVTASSVVTTIKADLAKYL